MKICTISLNQVIGLLKVSKVWGWEGSLAELPWQDFSDVSC